MRAFRNSPVLFALLFTLASSARGDAIYEVVELGPGIACALNDSGQIVLNDAGQVVLWEAGLRRTLFAGSASALNNRGEVVGRSAAGRAVLHRGGTAIDLGRGFARALNNLGVVLMDDGDVYLWDDGAITEVPELADRDLRAMNDLGWIVGNTSNDTERPFLFDGSTFALLAVPGFAADVNNAGTFVYTRITGAGSEPYLRRGDTSIPLGLLAPGDSIGQVNALNEQEQAVGSSGGRGFLWQNGRMSDLNRLLAPTFRESWFIVAGIDINAHGDILAVGFATGARGPSALLLRRRPVSVAVPEPSSLALAASGIGLGAVWLRRRAASQTSSCSRSRASTL